MTLRGQNKFCVIPRAIPRHSAQQGFSLLEVLIVIAILAILTTVGVGYYRNIVKNIELNETAKTTAADLKLTRSKAITGEDNLKWGIRFVNAASDYYEIFKTPTTYSDALKEITQTIYLQGSVVFTNPAESLPSVNLSWTNPVDSDFSNVVILRKVGSLITDVPTEGSSPNVNDAIGASVVVYNASGTSFSDTGVTGGTTYYYKIFPKDSRGNYDSGTATGPFTP